MARFEIYKKPSEASFTLKRSSNYFFVGGRHYEYNPADQDDTLGIPTIWTTSENLREFFVYASRGQFFKGHVMFLTLIWLRCLQESVLTLLPRTGK